MFFLKFLVLFTPYIGKCYKCWIEILPRFFLQEYCSFLGHPWGEYNNTNWGENMTQISSHCFTGVFKSGSFTKMVLFHFILSLKKMSLIHPLEYWIIKMSQISREGILKTSKIYFLEKG